MGDCRDSHWEEMKRQAQAEGRKQEQEEEDRRPAEETIPRIFSHVCFGEEHIYILSWEK